MKNKKIFLFVVLILVLSITVVSAENEILTHIPIKPAPGVRITSNYGWRIHPVTGVQSFHRGVDIGAPTGTYVYSFMDGEITMAEGNGTAGNEIRIKHLGGLETRYLHMSKRAVNVGDTVKAGQIIGTVGATGRVTGSHLHFEVRHNDIAVNPTRVSIVRKGE